MAILQHHTAAASLEKCVLLYRSEPKWEEALRLRAVIWLQVETGLDDKSESDICWPVKEQATQDSRSQCQLLNLF